MAVSHKRLKGRSDLAGRAGYGDTAPRTSHYYWGLKRYLVCTGDRQSLFTEFVEHVEPAKPDHNSVEFFGYTGHVNQAF